MSLWTMWFLQIDTFVTRWVKTHLRKFLHIFQDSRMKIILGVSKYTVTKKSHERNVTIKSKLNYWLCKIVENWNGNDVF